MSSLTQLQIELSRFLQQRTAIENDPSASAWAARALTGSSRLSPVQQLEVYREQYWLRHTSSLVEDFPGLTGVLGQRAWERLVEGYLERHPPTRFSLRDLGAQLPAYVAQQSWLERPELCQDMAALEWAYVECFDAPDTEPLSVADLQQIAPEAWASATCVLNPALRQLRVDYPVVELRRALKRSAGDRTSHAGATGAPSTLGEGGIVSYPDKKPQNLVVYRSERGLDVANLGAGEFELLSAFAQGVPLVEAVEGVVFAGHVTEAELGPWLTPVLRDFAAHGWITRVVPR